MDIDYHIVFTREDPECRELLEFLRERDIPHDESLKYESVVLDILSSHPDWPWIEAFVKKHKVFHLTDMVFSKEELLSAQWMSVRTIFRFGYPQPEDDFRYKEITYGRNGKCDSCNGGLSQVDAFRLKRIPAWKRRHIFAPFWIEDELFVSDVVAQAFTNAGITGVSFREVKTNGGTDIHPGVRQMYVSNILEEGLLEKDASIREENFCPYCGRRVVLAYGHEQQSYHKEIFENAPDVVKSGDLFGQGPWAASRDIIINQKVYRLLVEKKLDKALMFYPIKLV